MEAVVDSSSPPLVMVFSSETYRAAAFLEAASKLGIDVVIASDAGEAPAKLLGPRFISVDLADPEGGAERVASALYGRSAAGVVALDDAGVRLAAVASSRLGISSNSVAGIMATRDKAALRRRLDEAGIPQPRFSYVESLDETAIRKAGGECGFPCVVKPVELSGSTGVIRADGPDELVEAAREAFEIQHHYIKRPSALVVEEFLPGREIAVEGVLAGADLEILAFIDKPEAPDGPYFPETILLTPASIDDGDANVAAELVSRATASLGIVDGPIHAELRWGHDGSHILEVAARTIGGLCSKALRFGSESLEEVVLKRVLGDLGPATCSEGFSGVMMLYPERSGFVRGVDGIEEASAIPEIWGVDITVHDGSWVEPLPKGNRYLGFVFARASDRESCLTALVDARKAIHFEITESEHGT
jgi:biotin carboxylase